MVPFTFLISEVNPGYVLTYKDSELGITSKHQYVILLSLSKSRLPHSVLYFLFPPIYYLVLFFFIAN